MNAAELENLLAEAQQAGVTCINLRLARSALAAAMATGDAKRAQALVDTLLPHVVALLPQSGAVVALAALVEPFVGKLVDYANFKFAIEVEGIDLQDGPSAEIPTTTV